MDNHEINHKAESYYRREKKQILNLIPAGAHSVLDLGCASGMLGRQLRNSNRAAELVGVELFEPAGTEAAAYYDRIFLGDIESIQLPYHEHFDYVVCGDILEHLRDPWSVVGRIHGWLKKEGVLISSIPNIRYWRVLRDLIVFGKWEYVEAGILDNSHLRFFTRRSFQELLEQTEFKVIEHTPCIGGRKQALFNTLTCGLFAEFLGSQYMVTARKQQ